jgi:hypothetical protein
MRTPPRVPLVVAGLAGLAVLPVAQWAYLARAQEPRSAVGRAVQPAGRELKLSELLAVAQINLGAFGGSPPGAEPQPEPVPAVIHLNPQVTARAAKAWDKLQSVVPLNFPHETPLEDVLKAVRTATKGPDGRGLQIYLDPIGLQEAEKTATSPVSIDLDDVPLASSLGLALKQLGLKFYVQDDGLVVVTSDVDDDDHVTDPTAKILDELSALRREVAALRREAGLRHAGQAGEARATTPR